MTSSSTLNDLHINQTCYCPYTKPNWTISTKISTQICSYQSFVHLAYFLLLRKSQKYKLVHISDLAMRTNPVGYSCEFITSNVKTISNSVILYHSANWLFLSSRLKMAVDHLIIEPQQYWLNDVVLNTKIHVQVHCTMSLHKPLSTFPTSLSTDLWQKCVNNWWRTNPTAHTFHHFLLFRSKLQVPSCRQFYATHCISRD